MIPAYKIKSSFIYCAYTGTGEIPKVMLSLFLSEGFEVRLSL